MTLHLTIHESPSDEDRQAVINPLLAFNISRAGNPHIRPLAVLLTDDGGNHVGGLWGKRVYDWLVIELLAIPEQYRGSGYGKAIMIQAEAIARADNCIGIWLDTYEFQAREFYEKLGFEVFGTIDDHPVGQRRFFLSKRFNDAERCGRQSATGPTQT